MKTTFFIAFLLLAICYASAAQALLIDTVPVGNRNNAVDMQFPGLRGAVDHNYRIGKYEVTNAEYTEFLNAVARTDTHSLYDPGMKFSNGGGILQSGSSGSYEYNVGGRRDKPVVMVNFWDAARFTNWLHNGQPTGVQDNSSTEDGAYFLGGVTNPNNADVSRKADAQWFLPTEDEWYKAAYQKNDGSDDYWDYPTSTDSIITAEPPPGGTNSANFNNVVGNGSLTDVGAYTSSVSAYGTFDQGGNVEEWTETVRAFEGQRVVRGGNIRRTDFRSIRASGSVNFFNPIQTHNALGFRVATVPEPSTILLIGLGSLIMLAVRRRVRS